MAPKTPKYYCTENAGSWPNFIAPSVPIKSVMDTKNKNGEGILCYKYEKETKPLPN